jgi:hypothetical protein
VIGSIGWIWNPGIDFARGVVLVHRVLRSLCSVMSALNARGHQGDCDAVENKLWAITHIASSLQITLHRVNGD